MLLPLSARIAWAGIGAEAFVPEDHRERCAEQCTQRVRQPHRPFARRLRPVAFAAIHVERQAADHRLRRFALCQPGQVGKILVAAAAADHGQRARGQLQRVTDGHADARQPDIERQELARRCLLLLWVGSIIHAQLDAACQAGQHALPFRVEINRRRPFDQPAILDRLGGGFGDRPATAPRTSSGSIGVV